MAALQWLNDGVDDLLRDILNKQLPADWWCVLYQNNVPFNVANNQASFTPVSAPGYADIRLTPGFWTGGAAGGVATYSYPAQTFTFTSGAGQTVYGAYLGIGPRTKAYAQAVFGVPYVIPAGGGSLLLTPSLQLKACP